MKSKPLLNMTVISACLFLGAPGQSLSQLPQTHDVPIFHNDDGLGLLQDCTFMRAIAKGLLSEVPTSVAGRSTACLTAIKSIYHVVQSLQNTPASLQICLASKDPDWFDELEFLTAYMENQPADQLSQQPYGIWILQALKAKYPCR